MKKLKLITLVIIPVVLLTYAGLRISKSRSFQFFGGIVNSISTEEKVVALTFDDGPTKNTGQVLEALDRLDVRATFFVTGKELEEFPEEGRKIVQAGHELANHSYSHQRMVLYSLRFIREEIEKTDELIREAGYEGEIQFRPPYFKKLILLPYYLKKTNRETILCDVEPETTLGFSASGEEISNYVVDNTRQGSIILLHVMYDGRGEALRSLDNIVFSLREKGYEFVTVSEMLELRD